MNLPHPLIPGKLIRRYQRFLADVTLSTGETVTVHCPNSGSMMGLLQQGADVLLSASTNPKRRCRYTWELVRAGNIWVGINTLNPNRLVYEALTQGGVKELAGYARVRKEVRWGDHTRFDLLLEDGEKKCYVEVKNVTLAENQVALFPDAVTKRGARHLEELMQVVRDGHRGVMFFLVHREDCRTFRPAAEIDPVYAETLKAAATAGVEILVYRARIVPPTVTLERRLAFCL